jgi:hypothetical protein
LPDGASGFHPAAAIARTRFSASLRSIWQMVMMAPSE